MLKEFVSYLLDLNRPEIVEQDGKVYATNNLKRLDIEKDVRCIEARSLSGLVQYVKSNFDTDRKFMIHVENPTSVSLYDALDDENNRRRFLEATAMLPAITFDRFMQSENFNIQLQSKFVQTDDSAKIQKLVGTIVEDESVQTTDDGISQRVTAKIGVATLGDVGVPNPVSLKPIRTFIEVPQPESEFVLRIQKGPQAALFEADGAAWEINAMHNIKEYLDEQLEELITGGKVIIVA